LRALPIVTSGGKLTGVLTDRDICLALGTQNERATEVTAKELSSRRVWSCGPEDPISDALRIMSRARIRRLPVVDSSGIVVGILSLNVLWAQHADGTKRAGLSYEDFVNTLMVICQRPYAHARHANACETKFSSALGQITQ
jgi:predicted transcriptional regulator